MYTDDLIHLGILHQKKGMLAANNSLVEEAGLLRSSCIHYMSWSRHLKELSTISFSLPLLGQSMSLPTTTVHRIIEAQFWSSNFAAIISFHTRLLPALFRISASGIGHNLSFYPVAYCRRGDKNYDNRTLTWRKNWSVDMEQTPLSYRPTRKYVFLPVIKCQRAQLKQIGPPASAEDTSSSYQS